MSKGGGGGGSSGTVNTTVEPPEYAKPFLEYGLAQAKDRYTSEMPSYYPFSTTVGFSPESELALNMTRDRALAGSSLVNNAQNYIGNIAQTGGGLGLGANIFQRASTGGYQNEAMPMARNMLGGADFGEVMGRTRNMLGGADLGLSLDRTRDMLGGANFDEVLDYTRSTARGDMLNSNPYLQGAIDRAIDPVKDKIQSQFAMSGRYGSGANQDVLAKSLGGIASDIAYGDYQRERQNQLNAQQQLGNLAQQQFANQTGAIGALSGLQQQQFANQRGALGDLSNLQQQQFANQSGALGALGNLSQADIQRRLAGGSALSAMDTARMARQLEGTKLAPQFAELDYRDAQRLAQVGSARESDAMSQLQDNINRFNYEQNIDDQKLRNYMALISGGTVGSNTIQPVFRNQGASALGGALGGAQLASLINPSYAGMGAIGGGLLGLI